MEEMRIGFDALPWIDVAPGAREKRAVRADRAVRLVEFSPPFEEDGWCERGHTGCVVSGGFTLEHDAGSTRFDAGDALVIPPGAAHRHRAVVDRPVVLFLLEEPETGPEQGP